MSTIGETIDAMAELDDDIDRLMAKVKKLNRKRADLELKLMMQLDKQQIKKASGKRMNAAISSRRHPSIKDAVKFNAYVQKHRAFDLYQRRINSKAYFDRLEQGDTVPGVDVFEKKFVKLTAKRS